MKLSELSRLLLDAQDCDTLESYMAECGGSLPDNTYYGADDKAANTLKTLYSCRDGVSIQTLLELHGGSTAEFARDYGIPRRTVQNWSLKTNEHREPPQYLLRLILADLI